MALIHEWNLGADFYRKYKVEYMNRTETEEAIEEFKGHVAKLEARVKVHEQQTRGNTMASSKRRVMTSRPPKKC